MTLRRKLLAVAFPAAAAAVALAAVLSAYAIRRVLLRDFAERRASAAAQLLPDVRSGLAARAEQPLLTALAGALDPLDADWLAITDAEGVVVAHTDVTRRGRRLEDSWLEPVLSANESGWRASLEKRRLDLAVPVPPDSGDEFLLTAGLPPVERPLGWLVASFSLNQLIQAERRLMGLLVLIVASSVALTLAAAYFLLQRLLAPVEALARAVQQVGAGRYGTQVAMDSTDEVGELARRFNEMSSELQRTVVSKARLEEALHFLDSVIETLPLTVFVKDAPGLRYVRLNAVGEQILGRRREDIIGKTDAELFPEAQAVTFAHNDQTALSSPKPLDLPETELIIPGQKDRIVHVIKTAIRGRDGAPLFLLGILEDVTERKRTTESLRHAEKLSAVGSLAAGVAHEINNPLSVILGFARAAAKRLTPGDDLAMPLGVIERETQRCLDVVKDLLTFSRRREQRFEAFELREAVSATRFIMEARAQAKTVSLVTQLDEARCHGDRHQIEQAVLNLVSNAVDAAPAGTIVTVRVRPEGGAHAAIEVEDEGPGIPAELRLRVFEPFFTTKEAGQGTGLGLALVHEIASRHGGRIEIRDGRRGALVRMILPMEPSK